MAPKPTANFRRWRRGESRRFDLTAELKYKLTGNGNLLITGHGWTVTLSSAAVLFESDQDLPVGARIDLSIAWPVALYDKIPLRLWVSGTVTERRAKWVNVKIVRYDFRISRSVTRNGPAALTA